ncbi:hypothetical protein ON010_g3022 [Phytophthora cinnamomi]|nr:hypothetical protein ON010_g3022 [Phytophthora cinnamomi]
MPVSSYNIHSFGWAAFHAVSMEPLNNFQIAETRREIYRLGGATFVSNLPEPLDDFNMLTCCCYIIHRGSRATLLMEPLYNLQVAAPPIARRPATMDF